MKRILVDMNGVPADVYRRFPEYEIKRSETFTSNSRAEIKENVPNKKFPGIS